MTSALAVQSDIQPRLKRATQSTGERCPGVGQRPDERAIWGRATCPGCGLSQRVTDLGIMMSHYVMRPSETPANETRALTVAIPSTAISTRLDETIANLTTPTEPSTVGEFIRATIALTAALAAAQARIAELEQSPTPAPTPAPVINETVEQWQADWLQLNRLLAYYAIERGWCPQFEETIRGWNSHFRQGYLLSRNDVGASRESFRQNPPTPSRQRGSGTRQRREAAMARFRARQGR